MRNSPRPRAVVGKLVASLVAVAALASCGGGDPYAGLWTGSMSPGRSVTGLVLEDGSYYLLYSRPNDPAVLAGLVRGTADFASARITSDDARDYNWEVFRWPPLPGKATTLSAKIGGGSGGVNGAVNQKTFSVKPVPDSHLEPRLEDLAGSYMGTVVFAGGPRKMTFVVAPNGQVTTGIDGCSITGNVVPRVDVNGYDLTMTFGGLPCAFPGARFSGVAFFGEGERQLHAAVINPLYQQAIGFIGARPQQP